jgi:hypothetical protein
MRRLVFIMFASLFIIGGGCGSKTLLVDSQNSQLSININTNTNTDGISNQVSQVDVDTNISIDKTLPVLPKKFDIKVPFASQAPLGDWSMPYQEACEEASMIMVARYYKNEKLNNNIMAEEILKLVKWEGDNGYPIDLTAGQTAEVLQEYFGLKATLNKMVSETEIKKNLVAGNLIIVPLAGRDIGNPYYTQPGPLYHMLLIRGFDEENFITNDPGTKRGEAYHYRYGDLLWAVHDWVGGVREFHDPRPEPDMRTGERIMIVIQK